MTRQPAAPVLLVDVAERIGTVTLNRPAVRNALSRELRRELHRSVGQLGDDDDVDVVVLTGTDPAFCAGIDLKELAASSPEDAADALTGDDTRPWEQGPIPAIAKPVIGAVNGPAITGGLELVLWCDLLVASERAAFADTHARVGIMPGWGLTVLLPQAIGVRRARELSATGNFLDAPTALAWGLVNHVVSHEDLLPFCRRLALDIVSNDQRAVRRVLRTYADGGLMTAGDAWRLEAATAREWQGAGVDPADVEARRRAVTRRGRSQV
jgi:enoyl-CoA hydratase